MTRFGYMAASQLEVNKAIEIKHSGGQVEASNKQVAMKIATAVVRQDFPSEEGWKSVGLTVFSLDDSTVRNATPPLCTTCGDLESTCDCSVVNDPAVVVDHGHETAH